MHLEVVDSGEFDSLARFEWWLSEVWARGTTERVSESALKKILGLVLEFLDDLVHQLVLRAKLRPFLTSAEHWGRGLIAV